METGYAARVRAAADRFESGDSEFAAAEFAALAADVALAASDRAVMYVNLATVYSAMGRRDDVIAAFDRAIELEQRQDRFARDSKQVWLDNHPQTTHGQTSPFAGPFRASYFGWSVVWQATLGCAVVIATLLIVSATRRGNVGASDVIIGVGFIAVFGAAMAGIHALVRRQWITFDGSTVTYRPAIGRRRRFDVQQVSRVRRRNSRLGRTSRSPWQPTPTDRGESPSPHTPWRTLPSAANGCSASRSYPMSTSTPPPPRCCGPGARQTTAPRSAGSTGDGELVDVD